MTVQLVSEQPETPLPPPERAQPAPDSVGASSSGPSRAAAPRSIDADIAAIVRGTLSVIGAIAAIVSARLFVLIGVAFAFALAWRGIETPSWGAFGTLFVFCLLVVIPLIALSARKTGGGGL